MPPAPPSLTSTDLVDHVRSRVMDDAVAPAGLWVRRRPEAVTEAAPGGRPAGLLEATVLAVKDLVAVAGLPVGAGSRARAGAPPETRDADVVAALRSAGAVVAGTVALHELAFGVTGINDQVGFPANPHDPERIPGGSSSGSAVAVATGACDLAVGTDTGGSVRIPAALCGVVGFKPGRGRYPLLGVLPLAPTLDHVGLLARSMDEVVRAHRALTGDRVDLVQPTRLGVDRAGLAEASSEVAAAVEAALGRLADAGCTLVEVDGLDRDEIVAVSTTILLAEAATVHRDLLDSLEVDLVGPDIVARLRAGQAISRADYDDAGRDRHRILATAMETLGEIDAIMGPTVPIVAPTIDHARAAGPEVTGTLVSGTRLGNLTGLPALSLPLPGAGDALPVGLHLLAATDAQTLGLGLAVAAVLDR